MSDEATLRSLIRMIPPARALADQLEQSLHLETYAGTGDLAVQSLKGIQASIAQLINDPYIAALNLALASEVGDKEKVSAALLAAKQLAAFLEGQTGVAGLSGGGNVHIQTAPNINMNDVQGVAGLGKTLQRVFDTTEVPGDSA